MVVIQDLRSQLLLITTDSWKSCAKTTKTVPKMSNCISIIFAAVYICYITVIMLNVQTLQ